MKNLELKPSDILTVDGEVMQIDTITSQLASIEDVGGQYKGSIIIKFYDKNGEFHDINSDENRILMYTEDLVMSTWRTLEVSYKVRKNINAYFKKMLPNYELISVARQSNLPQDAHLYMISAVQKKTGEYAVWTSWNEKIQNLNFGHYCLKPKAEIVLDIFDNAFFDGFSEIKKAVKAESEEENERKKNPDQTRGEGLAACAGHGIIPLQRLEAGRLCTAESEQLVQFDAGRGHGQKRLHRNPF